jgi:6-phosphogluconolactonase
LLPDLDNSVSRRTFVVGASSLFLSAIASGHAAEITAGSRRFAYVGSISARKAVLPDSTTGVGEGIYLFEADLGTGALTYKGVTPNAANPWWIAINPAGTYLYSANEISTKEGDKSGSISAYEINRSTGELTLLGTVDSGGSRPAQLSVHPSGKYVLVANFGGYTLGVFPIQADGSLGAPTDMKPDDGAIGPKKASSAPPGGVQTNGHDRPRPHMIQADVSGRFVVSSDLSMDALLVWKFDLEKGVLTPNGLPPAIVGAGDGARHFAFHPDGRLLFTLQEEGGTIVSFDYNPSTGGLTRRQTLSTLPDGYKGSVYTSEIVVAPNGKFVYTVNRLYDSVVCFRIAKDGTLTKASEEWARGSFPRHIAFSPTGKFMYVCNQRNDEIATFAVNASTGVLSFTGQFTAAATPAILAFLP